jgi:murein DD-endopeptidase MepM/ murein hydrolase activator NlpD
MNATPTGLTGLPTAATARTQPSDAELATIKTLAQQFEATLMQQMLTAMRDTMLGDEDAKGLGASTMADQMHLELSMALAKAGGVGLTQSLLDSLTAKAGGVGGVNGATTAGVSPQALAERIAATAGYAAPAATAPLVPVVKTGLPTTRVDHDHGSVLPGDKHISSDFGWRLDPFTQHARFHHGTDLRVAYGREVKAATAGVVTFAGEKGGYGLTVIVDHGQGLETRYAHLSTIDVQVGGQVAAGEVIARSGNSGRSTGAHLHFEVRQDGQAMDPRQLDGRLGPVVDLE